MDFTLWFGGYYLPRTDKDHSPFRIVVVFIPVSQIATVSFLNDDGIKIQPEFGSFQGGALAQINQIDKRVERLVIERFAVIF